MDPRVYMLAGTFALLVIAVITTIVTMVRAVRRRRLVPAGPPASPGVWSDLPPAQQAEFDTSLEGLDVKLHPQSPSAALLLPLRTGTWIPPEAPAPADKLPEASLESRIATYPVVESPVQTRDDSAPEEPSPTPLVIEPPLEVAETALAEISTEVIEPPVAPDSLVEEPPASEVDAPAETAPAAVAAMPPTVAGVVGESPYSVVVSPEPTSKEIVAAELEFVVPTVEPLVAEPAVPVDRLADLDAEELPLPLEPPTVVIAEPEPPSPPAAAPLAPPSPPVSAEPPQTPEPAPVRLWRPPQVSEVPTQPDSPPAEPVLTDAFGQPPLDEGQDVPLLVLTQDELGSAGAIEQSVDAPRWEIPVVLAPAIERPAVVVHEPPPQPERPPAELVVEPSPAPPRPRAIVRAAVSERSEDTAVARIAPLAAQAVASRASVRETAPELTMAAPVEMWFGDHRIGVKQGSKTYDQFRRYADVLFDDLQAAGKP